MLPSWGGLLVQSVIVEAEGNRVQYCKFVNDPFVSRVSTETRQSKKQQHVFHHSCLLFSVFSFNFLIWEDGKGSLPLRKLRPSLLNYSNFHKFKFAIVGLVTFYLSIFYLRQLYFNSFRTIQFQMCSRDLNKF